MQGKLLGIINVDFDATDQPLIIYSAFVKYLRKNWNKTKQCVSSSWTSRKLMIQVGGREVFYDILIEFSIPMKLIRLTKLCLTETYSRGRVG